VKQIDKIRELLEDFINTCDDTSIGLIDYWERSSRIAKLEVKFNTKIASNKKLKWERNTANAINSFNNKMIEYKEDWQELLDMATQEEAQEIKQEYSQDLQKLEQKASKQYAKLRGDLLKQRLLSNQFTNIDQEILDALDSIVQTTFQDLTKVWGLDLIKPEQLFPKNDNQEGLSWMFENKDKE